MTPERLAEIRYDQAVTNDLWRTETPAWVDELAVALEAAWAERDRLVGENLTLRKLLWLHHGHAALYGDDGEMQCQQCPLDFKRATVQEIEALWFAKPPIPQIRQRALEECLAIIDELSQRPMVFWDDIKAAIRKLMGDPLPDAEEANHAQE